MLLCFHVVRVYAARWTLQPVLGYRDLDFELFKRKVECRGIDSLLRLENQLEAAKAEWGYISYSATLTTFCQRSVASWCRVS